MSAAPDQKKAEDALKKLDDELFSSLGNRGQRSSPKGGGHTDDIDAFFDDPLPVNNKAFGNTNRSVCRLEYQFPIHLTHSEQRPQNIYS